ncbi:MAG: hypothetical protein KF764_35165, partial [Labilithrix sp.]|nr:hypothetical protein [Labilithrix sp.]
ADPLAPLRAFEEARRAEAHFLETAPQDRAFGADPYDVVPLGDGRLAGILRGRDALVILEADLAERERIATPRAPSAIATYDGPPAGDLRPGDLFVASEVEPVLARYRPGARGVTRLADVDLGDVVGVRDVATGPEGVVYLVEEHDDRLITLRFSGARGDVERSERRVPRGPIRVARTRRAVFVASLLDHAVSVYPVDRHGALGDAVATTKIDGPYWGLEAIDTDDDGALVVAGGAEDHPLDRRGGFFGYVDSFVHVYRWDGKTGALARAAEVNVSEHGLIVPKAIAFGPCSAETGAHEALVSSYGGAAACLTWSRGLDAPPEVSVVAMPPGASSLARTPTGFVAANPLLDAWIAAPTRGAHPADRAKPAGGELRVVRANDTPGADTRTERERLGEALFFTGLMAPASSSEGAKSRFSCETCHFEGYVDGRTHHTGRGDVRATTKPLVGLFNNRPHFSRALDPDLSAVAENEFRVAGAPSTADPHFDLEPRDAPWLVDLGIAPRRRDAAELRLSLMAFLMSWTHRTNPRSAATRPFTAEERAGATLFRDRCEGCHQARASADDPRSRVPFARWESLVLGGGAPIVWGSDAYEKTGIVPYVHERGARVPSLRRVYKKRPYFTNGSAPDVATVLGRARFGAGGFSHDDAAGGPALDAPEMRALGAFIDLL